MRGTLQVSTSVSHLHPAEEIAAHYAAVPLRGLADDNGSVRLVVGHDETPPLVFRSVGPGGHAVVRF